MNGVHKQWLTVHNMPVLLHSIRAFTTVPDVSEIIVVLKQQDIPKAERMMQEHPITIPYKLVCGGDTRQESILHGFEQISDQSGFIAIHDGARPLVTAQSIQNVFQDAKTFGCAILGVRVKETMKVVDQTGCIAHTPNRKNLFVAQTPQVFRCDLYQTALHRAIQQGKRYTDDCQLMESMCIPVHLTEGDYSNIKITTPEDLHLVEAASKDACENIISFDRGITVSDDTKQQERKIPDMRIGQGYDVHCLALDRDLILGGVFVPHTTGLLGHSDADVLTHAVMDALLGAAGLGDIGRIFPDNDPKYHGISSLTLLKQVCTLLAAHGYHIENIDATIMAQRPKLAPYLNDMVRNLAMTCSMDADCINVKATTEEGLGFTGAEQGISSCAVALISK